MNLWNPEICQVSESVQKAAQGSNEDSDDLYCIVFKMRSLNSDFTMAKKYLFLFIDVATKVEKS